MDLGALWWPRATTETRGTRLISGVMEAGDDGMPVDAFRQLWRSLGYLRYPIGWFRSRGPVGCLARHGDRIFATHIGRAWVAA